MSKIEKMENAARGWIGNHARDIEQMVDAARAAGWDVSTGGLGCMTWRFGPVRLQVCEYGRWRAAVSGSDHGYAAALGAREALREAYYRCEDLVMREQIRPIYRAAGLLG